MMRLSTASLAFAVLLAASLAGKGFGLKETRRAGLDVDRVVSYLEERGLTVHSGDRYAASIWTVATRGAYLRGNWLSKRVFDGYDAIIDAACEAWRKLLNQPDTITSIGTRDWAHNGQSNDLWY